MTESRKIAAILAADVAGYSRLAGADEERTLARLRALRGDLMDPAVAAHRGRTVKRTGDGILVEFRSVVDAVRCAIEVQDGMVERNAGLPPDRAIQFRIGIHLGDIVEESDGDLMGDGVNIAARLEGIAAPGGICLSNAAYEQVRDRIEAAFIDLGDKALKNIARPVRVYAIAPTSNSVTPAKAGVHGSASETGADTDPGFRRGSEQGGAEAKNIAPAGQPRLSIVVLPFANIGGDPAQDYFVDGVTESLTTDLSRISGSFVIARNTAFTYKGKPVDVREVGRELGVRYVLEGSVQRGGNRVRVNVQLIDTESGNHLWAERFDKPVTDLFDMQDEIVARLANQLGAELIAAEARRAEHSSNADATDLYFQGQAWVNRGLSPLNMSKARDFFERALALEPSHIEALVGRAYVDVVVATVFYSEDRERRLAAAEAALTRVLSVAPDHAMAHLALGVVDAYTNRANEAIGQFGHALALDRNLASAHAHSGVAKLYIGRGEETEACTHEALRLSPRDPHAYLWVAGVAIAKLAQGADEEAIGWARRSIEANRNYPAPQLLLAAALAYLGRAEEARAALQAALALDPDFTIRRYRAAAPTDDPTYLAQRERIVEGMRKAGVPEG
jgi:TolB-like protein/class 3 adenylate cyclase